MGKRDIKKREDKKPKKGAKKLPIVPITLEQPPAEVEVVKKRRKVEDEVEE